MMDNDQKINGQINKNLIIAFVLFQIIFIVFCVVSIKGLLVEKKITVEDFADQPNIPIAGLGTSMPNSTTEDQDIVEVLLLETVNANTPEVNLSSDQVKIRDGSVKTHYFSDQNVNYYSAIVDIPKLEQSYWIFHEYSDESDNKNLSVNDQYLVLCLIDQSKVIYPDFQCKDNYGELTYNAIAEKYLRWFSFEDFLLYEIGGEGGRKIKIVSDLNKTVNTITR